MQEYSLLETDDPAQAVDEIRESFRETEELIKKKARACGIDIDEIAGRLTADKIAASRENTVGRPVPPGP